jgi:hypothetical protein
MKISKGFMHTQSIGLAMVLFASAAFAADKEVTVNVESKPAIKLTVPEGATAETKGDKTSVQINKLRFHVWPAKAKTVAESVPSVPEVIKSEFKWEATESTEEAKIAGKPAKHIKGKGAEADDGDPGTADVVVFSVGKHVFVACADREGKGNEDERKTFLKVLNSAKAP